MPKPRWLTTALAAALAALKWTPWLRDVARWFDDWDDEGAA
jgi:hypothetical protein